MVNPLKIVAIGVGSGFGRGILADVLGSKEFSELGCTLSLVDINEGALDVTYRFAQRVKEHYRSKVQIEATTDRREVLPGASYVITSVAIKRYPLWEQDFRVPLSYGFHHVLGENGGPGAAFHAMRNYELMIPICRDIEQLCPEALLLNFTNPEARIIRAVSELTKIRAVGLCHGTRGALTGASKILERPLEELDILSGGLNHFLWITKIADRKTGVDLYPELRNRAFSDPDCPDLPPLVKKMLEVFGLYTFPSDDHIGEYLSFGSEFCGTKWKYGGECRRVPLTEPTTGTRAHWLEHYASGQKPLDAVALNVSGELAVTIIRALETNQRYWADSVNVPNTEGYIDNLPRDTVVEVPAWVDGEGIHVQHIGALPEGIAAFCRTQASIQKLVVEAYRNRSRNTLLQAMLVDPIVNSITNAEKMIDDLLDLQQDYLPTFI
jgi:alpha-galactosidase